MQRAKAVKQETNQKSTSRRNRRTRSVGLLTFFSTNTLRTNFLRMVARVNMENRTRMAMTTRRVASRHHLRRRRRHQGGDAARARALLFTTSTIGELAHSVSGVRYFKGGWRQRGGNKDERGCKRVSSSPPRCYIVKVQVMVAVFR